MHEPKPLLLPLTATVVHACEEMRKRRTSVVPITHPDDDYLIGIFTGRDAICRVLGAGKDATKVTLGEVMTTNPTKITPYTLAIEALRLMWDGGFRRLP